MLSPEDQRLWRRVVNASGETIPACAVMMITGWDSERMAFEVDQPDADSVRSGQLLVNQPVSIPSGAEGQGTQTYPSEAMTSGSPGVGDDLGTATGSWSLAAGKKGFVALGSTASGRSMVSAASAGGGEWTPPEVVTDVVVQCNGDGTLTRTLTTKYLCRDGSLSETVQGCD